MLRLSASPASAPGSSPGPSPRRQAESSAPMDVRAATSWDAESSPGGPTPWAAWVSEGGPSLVMDRAAEPSPEPGVHFLLKDSTRPIHSFTLTSLPTSACGLRRQASSKAISLTFGSDGALFVNGESTT